MTADYFYSPTTQLYIARTPLTIDARVKNAADSTLVTLDWDDEGRIINIDFDDTKKLLRALDAQLLTPVQYWQAYNDALTLGGTNMLAALCADTYAEWLDRVYANEHEYIDTPTISSKYQYAGNIQQAHCPHGRPGWFTPEHNMSVTGEPLHVQQTREKFSTTWKYWSPDLTVTKLGACAPIRGYVTSVGKPSYDLGIPVDARQPKLMLRECRHAPLAPPIPQEILTQATHTTDLPEFITQHGAHFTTSKDTLVYTLREQFFDKLGTLALDHNISVPANTLCPLRSKQLHFTDFARFVSSAQQRLANALAHNKDIVFVMGHKNPDTDAIISSLFEAYRNHIIDTTITYVPVMQSERVPDEVTRLLGTLASTIPRTCDPSYLCARNSGLARWISVDQNREPEIQKYFITIIDHHRVCDAAQQRNIPKTLEMLGSTSALITRKYLGMGCTLDTEMARILYGATLMDTENRVEHKMTPTDVHIMDYLQKVSKIADDEQFYGNLMSALLNTDDAELLFRRDYKEDWGFGFAVAKIKNGFTPEGAPKKQNLLDRLYALAERNNHERNLPVTLLKITDYENDNVTVNRERIYLVFNTTTTPQFYHTLTRALEDVIRFEFPQEHIIAINDYIEFWGGGVQLSRKKTAPVLEPIVAAFNRYFFSPTLQQWIKRDFQKKTGNIKGTYSTDAQGRINNITYEEAQHLAREQHFTLLSLPEYWHALNDAKTANDTQMITSLQGSNFVEFLDTHAYNGTTVTHHNGPPLGVHIPPGNPGLIHPDDINRTTGLPVRVHPPNTYGNNELWRYWQPDAPEVIFCRSYIFLLNQPCLDGKFHPGDSFPNLGIRPVRAHIPQPDVNVTYDPNYLTVRITEEGDTHEWIWPKKIWEK